MPVTLGWCSIEANPPDFEMVWNDTPVLAPQAYEFYPPDLNPRFGLVGDSTTSLTYRITYTPAGTDAPVHVVEVTGAGVHEVDISGFPDRGMWEVQALGGDPTNRLLIMYMPEYGYGEFFPSQLQTVTTEVVLGWGYVPFYSNIPAIPPSSLDHEGSVGAFGLPGGYEGPFMGMSGMGLMPSEITVDAQFLPADGGDALDASFTLTREEGWYFKPDIFGLGSWVAGTYTLSSPDAGNTITFVITGSGTYGAAAWFSENYVPPDPPDPPDTFRGGWGGASGGVPVGLPTLASNAGTADFFAGMNWALGIDQTYPDPPMDGFDFTVVFTPADGGPVITQSFAVSGPTYFGTDFFVMESILTPVYGVYEIRIEVLGVLAQNKQVVVIADGGAYGVVAWYSEEEVPPISAFWAALINAKEAV